MFFEAVFSRGKEGMALKKRGAGALECQEEETGAEQSKIVGRNC